MISFFSRLASAVPHRVAVSAILVGTVLASQLAWFAAQAAQGTPATGEDDAQSLSAIEEQVEVLERDLRAREQRRDQMYADLEQTERDIAALARGGRQLDAMVAEQRAALAALRVQLEEVRGELSAARVVLAELLRSAHAMGRGNRLRMVLNQEDVTRSGRLFGYYRTLGQKRARQIALVDQQAKRLKGLSQQAATEAERLAELARRQEDTRERLAAAQQERNQILANLERSIVAGRDRVESLREDAARLRKLAKELSLHSEIRDVFHLDQESLATRRGALSWPVRHARVLTSFRPRATGDLHGDGVLLSATPGEEVRAVHGGQVVYSDWLRGFGLLLVIDHHDGYMTIYGHNQSLLKEPGEWVGAGETIALAGASGGSDRDGLYFALRHQGQPLDPRLWCADPVN
ncbi:murein hydrolase activator EnvC family protein [Thiorhodovibrio frisius]|uniref:Membrane-bound metallopeptidase n=1 Tax=Thiorhodovibrio frisius TaxID=631362 RepID=H8YZF5_9GAMM|nr:peptidoglycan DD-metalloendopeptidase family protein [Thiorhodovibrio frisius]EIC22082.1 membrane-bound metallopeptidase [Thiorhodovibrio frisius]WPL24375.1 Septal ring factor [Thiorhodovibrio frisius]